MAKSAPRQKGKARQLVWDWVPQEKQLRFLRAAGLAALWGFSDEPQVDEILYGGAAGSGKSSALVAAAIARCLTVSNARVIYFRRTFPELSGPGGVIEYALSILPQKMSDGTDVRKWLKAEHKVEFFNGSTLTFAHLQNEDDKHKYQGTQVDMVIFDELTHFSETQFLYFSLSRVRKWRADLETFPIVLCGTNPGSVGHAWVKSRFVDAGPTGEVFVGDDGRRRMFVPARLEDNQKLMEADPNYERALDALPEADRAALKYGDWDSYAGQFFSDWSRRIHVIKPFKIPKEWPRSSGYDFGGNVSVHLWFAVDPMTSLAYCYREYATVREMGPGKFESAGALLPVQAKEILEREREGDDPPLEWRAADPSVIGQVGNYSSGEKLAETLANNGVFLEASDNARVHGWHRVKMWLAPIKGFDGGFVEDDYGMVAPLRFFDTCRYTIATLPTLPHDARNPNDLDTHAEDHGADALRYWAMHRPEPVSMDPVRYRAQKKANRNKHWSEIEDEEEAEIVADERGLYSPVMPRRRSS